MIAGVPSRRVQASGAAVLVCLLMGLTWLAPVVVASVPDSGSLLRDTTVVLEGPAWAGAMSRLFSLFWAATTTLLVVAAFVAAAHRRMPLLALGVLAMVLTLDDTLLLHDDVLPRNGVPEKAVQGAYAVAGLVLATRWWSERARAVGLSFFAGGALLAASIAVDVLVDDWYLIEEGFKLLGIVSWGLCAIWAMGDELAGPARRDAPSAATARAQRRADAGAPPDQDVLGLTGGLTRWVRPVGQPAPELSGAVERRESDRSPRSSAGVGDVHDDALRVVEGEDAEPLR